MKIHITKKGESIDSIAKHYSVSRQDLSGINPHVSLGSDLVPGLKLKIPESNRVGKSTTTSIENYYPSLDSHRPVKEEAVPIGLKPFENQHDHVVAVNGSYHDQHQNPGYHGFNHHQHQEPAPVPVPHTHGEVPHQMDSNTPWAHLNNSSTHLSQPAPHHPWNNPHAQFAPPNTEHNRAFYPMSPYYPSYPPYGPYGPYQYPPYYPSYPLPIPLPIIGGGYGGYGGGFGHGGGHGHGGGFGHGGGHGHREENTQQQPHQQHQSHQQ